jgi:hypothetical protein
VPTSLLATEPDLPPTNTLSGTRCLATQHPGTGTQERESIRENPRDSCASLLNMYNSCGEDVSMTWAVAAGARKSKGCWVGLSCEVQRCVCFEKANGIRASQDGALG